MQCEKCGSVSHRANECVFEKYAHHIKNSSRKSYIATETLLNQKVAKKNIKGFSARTIRKRLALLPVPKASLPPPPAPSINANVEDGIDLKDDEKMKTDTIVEHPAGGGEDKYVVWEEDFLRRKKRCRRAYDKDGRKIKGGRKIEAGCFHVAFSCSLCDTLISIPGDVFEKVFRHIIKMKLTGFDRFDKEATDGVTIDDARLRNAVRIVRDTEGILDNQGGGVLNKYALAFPNCNRIGSHYLNHHRDQKRDWCAAANYSIDWWMYTTHHRLNKPGGEKEDPDDQEY